MKKKTLKKSPKPRHLMEEVRNQTNRETNKALNFTKYILKGYFTNLPNSAYCKRFQLIKILYPHRTCTILVNNALLLYDVIVLYYPLM